MFDTVGLWRELIICSLLQDFSKGKGSSLQLIYNAHIFFSLWGKDTAVRTPPGEEVRLLKFNGKSKANPLQGP